MKLSFIKTSFAVFFTIFFAACSPSSSQSKSKDSKFEVKVCGKDIDCKEDRICFKGSCINPSANHTQLDSPDYYITNQQDIEKAQDACQLNASTLSYIYDIKRVKVSNGDVEVITSVVCIDDNAYKYKYVYPNR